MIGGKDVSISNQWQPSNNYRSASCSQIIANNGNILNPNISGVNTGATIMKRYVDGKLTSENLWPWPMNKRIIDAMQQSGREPIDVTKTIFELCGGTLPDEFKTNPNGSSIVEAAKDWLMNPAKRSLYEDLLKRQNNDIDTIIKQLRPNKWNMTGTGEFLYQNFTYPPLINRNRNHQFHYYVPSHYSSSKPIGLMLWLHGGGGHFSGEIDWLYKMNMRYEPSGLIPAMLGQRQIILITSWYTL